MKVLNFGSMNLDHVYQVAHFVQPGETISALQQKVTCGGKGLNQSVALAKAGARVYHAGCVGQGGQMLIEALKEQGVNTEYVKYVSQMQGNAMIQVDPDGQNCIVLFGGSNQCITYEQIEETLENFEQGDYLVLQNEVNLVPQIVDAAYEKGMRIVLNPSPYDDKLEQVDLARVHWLLVNEVEAAQICKAAAKEDDDSICAGEDPEALKEAVRRILLERYPGLSVVLTLGGKGSICLTGEKEIRQKAISVEAVDTTAAGDTFTGYFLATLMENDDLAYCMKRASIAAALSVTRAGASASIPTRDDVFWKEKELLVQQYDRENKNCEKGQVVFTGSSLMEMFPIEAWSREWENAPKTYNRGVSGYTTLQLKPILDICACDLQPAKVFINIGTNDLSNPDYTIEEVMERYDEILTEMEEKIPDVVIYLMAYYPINYDAAEVWMKPTLAVRNNAKIDLANEAVCRLAGKHGQRYIDVNRNLKDAQGNLKAEYTIEGMHIKPEGYRQILPEVMKYVLE